MEPLKLIHTEVIDSVKKHIKTKTPGLIYMNVTTPMVFINSEDQINKDECERYGYTTYLTHHTGGPVILNDGDFVFAQFFSFKEKEKNPKEFVNYFVNWLISKGLNAEFTKNDILIDGHKICGMGVKSYRNFYYFVCFININSNLNHIKAISNKIMEKIPKNLSEYGITVTEIEQMFLDFYKQL